LSYARLCSPYRRSHRAVYYTFSTTSSDPSDMRHPRTRRLSILSGASSGTRIIREHPSRREITSSAILCELCACEASCSTSSTQAVPCRAFPWACDNFAAPIRCTPARHIHARWILPQSPCTEVATCRSGRLQ